jgi:hypothetical protein
MTDSPDHAAGAHGSAERTPADVAKPDLKPAAADPGDAERDDDKPHHEKRLARDRSLAFNVTRVLVLAYPVLAARLICVTKQ